MSRGVGTQLVELGDLVRSAWQRTGRQVANGQGADAAICIRGVLHGEVIGLATETPTRTCGTAGT
ncbi:MAG: hypothetical protein WA006_08740 [Rhodoglobus sp.]